MGVSPFEKNFRSNCILLKYNVAVDKYNYIKVSQRISSTGGFKDI